MTHHSIFRRATQWLVLALLVGFLGLAMAQSEPTLNQVYATAQEGKLDQAQVMMQQVLVLHPNSGKAHFVQAELFARQGKLGSAREALATAERLSPGLGFAKPEAVRALRSQLSAKTGSLASGSPPLTHSVAPAAASGSSFSWGLPLLLAGAVIVVGYLIFRRKSTATEQQPMYAAQGGLSGPQTFGATPGYGGGAMPPGYAQPSGSGLGGRIMGGVATGLAVGAGVMAAEAIGRSLMGSHDQPVSHPDSLNNDYRPLTGNDDMVGQGFGIKDTGSWDDSGSDMGGGSNDWD